MIVTREDRAVFTHELQDRRQRGRPRLHTIATSVKLTEPVFDALCRKAQRNGDSLHKTMREALAAYAGVPTFGSQNNPADGGRW